MENGGRWRLDGGNSDLLMDDDDNVKIDMPTDGNQRQV
jgi:hypothetical protein